MRRKIFIGRALNNHGWYEIGGGTKSWDSDEGFTRYSLDEWCPRQFETYVTIMQDGYEVELLEGIVFEVLSATITLTDKDSPIGLSCRRGLLQFGFYKEDNSCFSGYSYPIDLMDDSTFLRAFNVERDGKKVRIKKDGINYNVESIVVELESYK